MIIDSISMKDFQCYFGGHEKNTLKFRSGINLVVGDNGGGKSKLYDAFYWVLYDQVFNSDKREFVTTKNYQENLISDRTKNECPIGKQITTEIVLIVVDSRDTKYRVTRVYKSKKIDDRIWQGEESSRLLIEEYKVTRWQSVPSEKHSSILERVIPSHLKPYMWFQGEQVDSLMDFKNKSALMQAINLLSDIGEYDDLITISKTGADKSAKNYAKAASLLSKNKTESKKLAALLEGIQKNIASSEQSKDHNFNSKNEAQLNIDRLINVSKELQDHPGLPNIVGKINQFWMLTAVMMLEHYFWPIVARLMKQIYWF